MTWTITGSPMLHGWRQGLWVRRLGETSAPTGRRNEGRRRNNPEEDIGRQSHVKKDQVITGAPLLIGYWSFLLVCSESSVMVCFESFVLLVRPRSVARVIGMFWVFCPTLFRILLSWFILGPLSWTVLGLLSFSVLDPLLLLIRGLLFFSQ